MSAPRTSDVDILTRVASDLQHCEDLELHFPRRAHYHPSIQVYIDSDWASCQSTRRSRSGGVLLYRDCVVSHYCRMQDAVALSSGEAELKSTCKGLAEGLGLQELASFLNRT